MQTARKYRPSEQLALKMFTLRILTNIKKLTHRAGATMSRFALHNLLLIFVLFGQVTDSLSFYPQIYHNKVIPRGIFSVKYNVDWLDCIQECMSCEFCVSYNYEVVRGVNQSCELSSCGLELPGGCDHGVLRFSKGFLFQQLKNNQNKDWESCDVIAKPEVPTRPSYSKDCADAYKQGANTDKMYRIDPDGKGAFTALCDQTKDGGGWTVIQNRVNGGTQNFDLGWDAYSNGFGEFGAEFWLGLNRIHRLTNAGNNELRIELTNKDGQRVYAEYRNFKVSSKETKFVLNAQYHDGSAGDSLQAHFSKPFSTKDKDNDNCTDCSCAVRFFGAWWYDGTHQACQTSNLNSETEISWKTWGYTIKGSTMKLRPFGFQ